MQVARFLRSRWRSLSDRRSEAESLLEIQRLFQEQQVDRVVVDIAPSGHTLNLFGLMDFLDTFLHSLELFQEKHRDANQVIPAFGVASTGVLHS
ncbi:ArsA-related P-loop ATPase [Nostoc sp. C117]|uniref:ArsA-related P-loop ATPase n=1 Tax=Nostoc sp. C117 TaxID=3349875 RepID=UPI00370DA87D